MKLSLDLGSGPNPRNPFKADKVFGLDVDAFNDAVQKCDIGMEPLPFADSSPAKPTGTRSGCSLPRNRSIPELRRYEQGR